ncbi:hypothetical protein DB346_23605 [Verrucomicrobia bacterium LW23]|nr:hypothetical protein DB346_23605 [Verrucomicrobia bacterium LW23]
MLLITFQQMERKFIDIFILLLYPHSDELSNILVKELSFGKILKVTEAIINSKIANESVKNEYKDQIERATRLEQERNKYVHSHYKIDQTNPTEPMVFQLLRSKITKSFQLDKETIDQSAPLIWKLVEENQSLANELGLTWIKLFREIAPEDIVEQVFNNPEIQKRAREVIAAAPKD